MHQVVVPGLGDDHNVAHRPLDRSALQLFGDLPDTGGGLYESGMRHPLIVLDLLEDLVDIDCVVEAVVVETWRREGR